MGRRSHSQTLHLWANGDYVGRWTVNANGTSELQYDIAWRRSARGRPISLSLPFNLRNEPLKGASVAHYFEGLLPDSDIIRKRVAARFKTGSIDAVDLLAAIGRDCVGALQLLPEGPPRPKLSPASHLRQLLHRFGRADYLQGRKSAANQVVRPVPSQQQSSPRYKVSNCSAAEFLYLGFVRDHSYFSYCSPCLARVANTTFLPD